MIYVECRPDEALVRWLTNLPRRRVVHELKGKYEVCKRLSRETNRRALIDEDPGKQQPAYLQTITLLEELPELGLKLFGDERRQNRVAVLCPRLEEWTLRAASNEGIDVARYGLPDRPSSLHRVIGSRINNLHRLLEALDDAGSARLAELARLLA